MDNKDDAIPPRPLWAKAARILFALIGIGAILYLSGGYQYFFLHRTPSGAEQPPLSSKVNAEQLTVPVVVHVLAGEPGSERTADDAARIIENANRIWKQANITFVVHDILYHETSVEELRAFDREPHAFITNSETYDPSVANLYLTRTLSGPPFQRAGVNGLAYGGTSAVSVADFTSTLDYRTLAHEFGHLLGLPHVSNTTQLMSTGATGVDLTLEEIAIARHAASEFIVDRL